MAISKIKSESIDLTDTGYTFGDLLVSGDLTIDTSSLTVDSTNNRVGIGTTTPSSVLTVEGPSGNQIRVQTSDTVFYRFGRNSGTGYLDFWGTQSGFTGYTFGGTNGERMRIDSSGNVGIGTSSPTARLTVIEDVSRSALTGTGVGQIHISGGATPADNDVSSITFSTNNTTTTSSIIGNQITNNGSNLFFGTSNNYGSGVTNTAMFIDYAGHIGIGTSTLPRTLNIYGSSNGTIGLDNIATGSPQIAFKQAGVDKAYLSYWDAFDTLSLSDGSGNGLHFKPSTGNVGIGTSSPSSKFEVSQGGGNVKVAIFEKTGNDVYPPGITLFKNRTATNGDSVGYVGFNGKDSAGNETSYAEIRAYAQDTANGSEDGYLTFKTTGSASDTERMRIDSSGNLLVGTTSEWANNSTGIALHPIGSHGVTNSFSTAWTIPNNVSGLLFVQGDNSGQYGGTALFMLNKINGFNATITQITGFAGDVSGYGSSWQLSGSNAFQLKHTVPNQTINYKLKFIAM